MSLVPRKVYLVVGHQADDVKEAVLAEFDEGHIEFVKQEQQLGTGDAVNSARNHLADSDGILLVLSGDVPMIRRETKASPPHLLVVIEIRPAATPAPVFDVVRV